MLSFCHFCHFVLCSEMGFCAVSHKPDYQNKYCFKLLCTFLAFQDESNAVSTTVHAITTKCICTQCWPPGVCVPKETSTSQVASTVQLHQFSQSCLHDQVSERQLAVLCWCNECSHTRTHACTHTHTHICMHVHTHTHVQTCMHAPTHTDMHLQHTHTHTHTHTHDH